MATEKRAVRAADVPDHPHADASHEHTHPSVDNAGNNGVTTHSHAHNHDDGSVDHASDAHGHGTLIADLAPANQVDGDGDADDGFPVGSALGLTSQRPTNHRFAATYSPSAVARMTVARQERVHTGRVEVRAGQNGKRAIVGHAAMFDTPYVVNDFWMTFAERVSPGAFAKTIKEADVRCLFNHDPNIVLGRTKNNTLTLREDAEGLVYEATPPDTTWARDLMTSMERGDVDGSSMGFLPVREKWSTILNPEGDQEDVGGEEADSPSDLDVMDCRTLLEVQLYDVSPVTFPASSTTDSSVRAELRSAGFDIDGLIRIVMRHSRGLSMPNRDRDMIRASVDYLRRLLPNEGSAGSGAPVRADHPPTTNRPQRTAPVVSDYATRDLFNRLDQLHQAIEKG